MDGSARPVAIILEDQPIISIYVEDLLKDSGIQIGGVFTDCNHAMDWLRSHKADIAILDVLIGQGSCAPVAEQLRQQGTPFILYTGSEHTAKLDAAFGSALTVDKPDRPGELMKAVRATLASRLNSPEPQECA